jgi:anti-anti-sigma factor
MDISTINGNVTVLTVTGEIDSNTFSQLIEYADQQLAAGHTRLVLDLSGVNYISSAGLVALQTIVGRAAAYNGKAIVCGVNAPVMKVLKLAGFDQFLGVMPDRASAVASLEN